MPIYVYHCDKCRKEFEAVQSITEDPLSECKCGSSGTVRRVIQPAMVQYNAPGFYLTDYAGHGNAPKEKAAETPAAETSNTEPSPPEAPSTSPTPAGSESSETKS
ncbi:MAG: FmdB family zinc ribbon protein [Fimbriimonadaceae bacterium]